jgi:hypothetical protein
MMQTTELEPRAVMQALANQFPVLENAPGINDWNPEKLDEWAAGKASSGERHAAAFVLRVWNYYNDWKVGQFDVMAALSTWDEENRRPFVEWARKPYWM